MWPWWRMSSSVADLQKPATSVVLRFAVLVAAPGVVGAGDLGDVFVGQLAVDAVDERAELAGVDEQGLAGPLAEFSVLLVAGDEPQADGDLRAVEQLAGERDHAVDEVGLDDVLADLAFA